ncbi:MAG: mhpB [Conexibacter sp.]|nr:mhpB [Conexibacter sp.]
MSSAERLVVCASHSPAMTRDADESQGLVFREGVEKARALVERFDPELVVFFGSDHRRAFTRTVPAIAVMTSAASLGDLGSPEGAYDIPEDLARDLAGGLLARDFDITVVGDVELDHGFGQTLGQVVGELDRLPVVPIYINCAMPPLPTCARALALGQAVGAQLDALNRRVLIIGSGGLSHSPPSLEAAAVGLSDEERRELNRVGMPAARKKIRPEWDRTFLERLTNRDWDALAAMTDADIDPAGVGAHEVRTWVAAVAAAGTPVEVLAYEPVPDWITGMAVVATA